MERRTASLAIPCVLAVCLAAGCARVPYRYSADIEDRTTMRLRPTETQIERGRPHRFLDGLGHYVLSLPSKIILLNWRVDNHRISPETEGKIVEYLEANDLPSVKVRLNQYAPGGEWSRLVRNSGVPGFFRYTLGVVTVAMYTAMPERAFGGDNYNPYTNTISIYSDHKSIALHEAAHAKDFAGRPRGFRGWYAAMRMLPLVPLWQEAIATGDAIGYDRVHGLVADEKADYKILYPAYCTYIAGEGLQWVRVEQWVQYAVIAAAAIPGHIVGRIKAACVRDRAPRPVEASSPPPTPPPTLTPAPPPRPSPTAPPERPSDAPRGFSPEVTF